MKITATSITDVTYPPGFIEIDVAPTVTTAPVVIVDGIAAVPPTFEDYYENMNGVELQSDAWVGLPYAAENAQRLLEHFSETVCPDPRARWTLLQALRTIR